MEVTMKLTKETKGTFVYGSDDENPLITTVYLQKSGMPEKAPKSIKVTVEFE